MPGIGEATARGAIDGDGAWRRGSRTRSPATSRRRAPAPRTARSSGSSMRCAPSPADVEGAGHRRHRARAPPVRRHPARAVRSRRAPPLRSRPAADDRRRLSQPRGVPLRARAGAAAGHAGPRLRRRPARTTSSSSAPRTARRAREWDAVFVIWAVDGWFPTARALGDDDRSRKSAACMYVAHDSGRATTSFVTLSAATSTTPGAAPTTRWTSSRAFSIAACARGCSASSWTDPSRRRPTRQRDRCRSWTCARCSRGALGGRETATACRGFTRKSKRPQHADTTAAKTWGELLRRHPSRCCSSPQEFFVVSACDRLVFLRENPRQAVAAKDRPFPG